MNYCKSILTGATALATVLALSPAWSETEREQGAMNQQAAAEAQPAMTEEAQDAEQLLREATTVVEKMRQDADAQQALQLAQGIFIVPDFARGAAIAGVSGGQGVVLTRQDGQWRNPAFYNIGSISLGAQAGIAAGEIAMLLMTDAAVESFKQENNFSLDAEAGLAIIDWSEAAQASWGKGDIVLWSDTEGAFIGAELAITDIFSDDEANNAYYEQEVSVADILTGAVRNPREDIMSQALR